MCSGLFRTEAAVAADGDHDTAVDAGIMQSALHDSRTGTGSYPQCSGDGCRLIEVYRGRAVSRSVRR